MAIGWALATGERVAGGAEERGQIAARAYGSQVLLTHLVLQLLAQDHDITRGVDAELDPIAGDLEDLDRDVVLDDDRLIDLPAQDQQCAPPSRDSADDRMPHGVSRLREHELASAPGPDVDHERTE